MRLIDVDARVTVQSYDVEHEEFMSEEMSIEQALDFATSKGCPSIIDAVPVEWLRRQYHKYMQNNDKLMCDAYAVVMGEWHDWQKNRRKNDD